MVEVFGRRGLERVDLAALRIHSRHHVLDRAVLAGGVDGLEHEQQRPAILRVEAILQLGDRVDAVLERLERTGLVSGVQAAAVARIDVLQAEALAVLDAVRTRETPGLFDEVAHDGMAPAFQASLSECSRSCSRK